MTIRIDIESLTIDETVDFEDIAEVALDEFLEKGTKKGRALKALAFIALRRDQPDITLDEVGRMLVADLDMPDPTENPTGADA